MEVVRFHHIFITSASIVNFWALTNSRNFMIEALMPKTKNCVFDLVEEAGFDMQDWVESYSGGANYKANPKYCYEWAYIQPGKVVILNLWHADMTEKDGQVTHRGNYRRDADFYRKSSSKPQWVKRATTLDQAIRTARDGSLPVRVIVLKGKVREKDDPAATPSKVSFRELDGDPWTITAYNDATGEYELTRGILEQQYVDQFDINEAETPTLGRHEVNISTFVRNAAVRRGALARAVGRCELCGEPGFEMTTGALYLETHHIVPLSEGGPDHLSNVVAVCPNDHRRAHFGRDRDEIARRLAAVTGASLTAPTA